MIPMGYTAKHVSYKHQGLKADQVVDIYSVSDCVSESFHWSIDGYWKDFENWKHNWYGFFNSPEAIAELAAKRGVDLSNTKMFYYEAYELQYIGGDVGWVHFPERLEWLAEAAPLALKPEVITPIQKNLAGYDIVSYDPQGIFPDHSYLSCNYMAEELRVNEHCLLELFEEAKFSVETGIFDECEDGDIRIFAVYTLDDQ